MNIRTATLLLGIIAFCGCTIREIRIGEYTYKSTRFGNKEQIGQIELEHPDGTFFRVRAFSSDQVSALGVVTEAAVSAAMKSVKP